MITRFMQKARGLARLFSKPAPPRAPRIAVICAAHRGNSGMYSVDSSAVHYFEGRGLAFDIFYAQRPPDREADVIAGHTAKLFRRMKDLSGYSDIVYWGDFLNNPVYGRGDFANRDRGFGHSATTREGYDAWKRLFNFYGARRPGNAVSVGNNFQHDFAAELPNAKPIFARIEKNFRAILPRDPHSLQSLSSMLSPEGRSVARQGMDCAFLLPPLPAQPKDDIFCYTFNRSKLPQRERLIRRIEEVTGLRGQPMPGWMHLKEADAEADFQAMRAKIASARFVVSDTYHFLINSMVLGVPVVGLGRTAEKQTGTLGDFKKRMLFGMLDLDAQYVEMGDETPEAYAERVAEICRAAPNLDPAQLYARMHTLRDGFRGDLDQLFPGDA
ncbi:polysaccharide pyruvyl transferase family protein [Falsirhodobacter algicola]|uniref:Polysaccharide pyruvyl transferase domain-containing protein n=1 Tax=Falsirhodobacter algicola TaxID=2692330 RepID=A0A8J8MSK9_9RHOB|nr:polysaccharide pyruvyl transferase family protein [Falsirhodobacter algicola]QUS35970.1 hypothetical protein GR316_06660 [Falsirhodobacter algicola]